MLPIPLSPSWISVHARIHALCAARARGRCSVLCAHACVSHREGPHQSQYFAVPLTTRPVYRYTARSLDSSEISRKLRCLLYHGIDVPFVGARRKIFASRASHSGPF